MHLANLARCHAMDVASLCLEFIQPTCIKHKSDAIVFLRYGMDWRAIRGLSGFTHAPRKHPLDLNVHSSSVHDWNWVLFDCERTCVRYLDSMLVEMRETWHIGKNVSIIRKHAAQVGFRLFVEVRRI